MEPKYQVLHDRQGPLPYHVRILDAGNRLIAFRRFWTEIEAHDWGRRQIIRWGVRINPHYDKLPMGVTE
jgi:hypothetical protein